MLVKIEDAINNKLKYEREEKDGKRLAGQKRVKISLMRPSAAKHRRDRPEKLQCTSAY